MESRTIRVQNWNSKTANNLIFLIYSAGNGCPFFRRKQRENSSLFFYYTFLKGIN